MLLYIPHYTQHLFLRVSQEIVTGSTWAWLSCRQPIPSGTRRRSHRTATLTSRTHARTASAKRSNPRTNILLFCPGSPHIIRILTSNKYRTMDLPPPSYEDAIRQGPGNTPGHNHNHNHGNSQGRLPLELQGTSIRDLSSGQVLYKLSRPVTSLPKPGPNSSSSVTFERVEYNNTTPEAKSTGIHKDDSQSKSEPEQEPENKHLFYLVHPRDAQYRRDTPAYYITCLSASASPDKMQGNLQFETRGTVLHGTEFQALLSRGRTWEHKPLFDIRGKVPLFVARREGLMGGQYTWRENLGREVGHEGARNGDSRVLVITSAMEQEKRDALVALWVLRIWYEVAESPKAKREGWFPCLGLYGRLLTLFRDGTNDTGLGFFKSRCISKEGRGSWGSWGFGSGWRRGWLLNSQPFTISYFSGLCIMNGVSIIQSITWNMHERADLRYLGVCKFHSKWRNVVRTWMACSGG